MVEVAFYYKICYGRSVAYLLGLLGLAAEPVFVPVESTVPSGEPDSVLE